MSTSGKSWPPQPHDRAYRRFFSHREMVEDLVRGFIHEPWVEQLDFSQMQQISDVFVAEDYDRRDADTIWRIRWRSPRQDAPPLHVVLIFEFLSRPDAWAAVRLMAYVALFYQRLIDNQNLKPGTALPPVVPIVLYNGKARWVASEELSDLIADLPGLERYRPRLRYRVLDEKRFPRAQLEQMPNRAAALFQLEQSRGPEDVLAGLERLQKILSDPKDRLYGVYTRWLTEIFLASSAPSDVIEQIQTLEDFTVLVENILEWKDSVRREGEQLGLRKGEILGLRKGEILGLQKGEILGLRKGEVLGLQKGEILGLRKGEMAVLRRQLERKFGPLSEDALDRLERADVDQLLVWSDRVLTAQTLEEVWEG